MSIKVHAIVDYALAAFVLASPWIFGFNNVARPQQVTMAYGAALLALALISNHGYGIARIVNVRFHLVMDVLLGIGLATSPWAFGFNNYLYLPQLVMGIAVMSAALVTETVARTRESDLADERRTVAGNEGTSAPVNTVNRPTQSTGDTTSTGDTQITGDSDVNGDQRPL